MRRLRIAAFCIVIVMGGSLGAWPRPCLAGPNLVANGALERPQELATTHPNPGGDGLYWALDGDSHFGRFVVSGVTNIRPYLEGVRVAYYEFGREATGGTRGLLIDTEQLDNPEDTARMSLEFDLKGLIRPNKTYEYVFQGVLPGVNEGQGKNFKVIAPAMWADGRPIGAEFDVMFDGVPSDRSGRIKVPDFQRQTGQASLIIEIPRDFKDQLLLLRVVLREIDEDLLAGRQPAMPVPIRYIPAQSDIEYRIEEAIRECAGNLRMALDNIELRPPGGLPESENEAQILRVALITAALAELRYANDAPPANEDEKRAREQFAELLDEALDYLATPRREPPRDGGDQTGSGSRSRSRSASQSGSRAEPEMERGPDEPIRTETVAWRLYCLARHGDPKKHGRTMARDLQFLHYAQRDDGGWAEISAEYDKDEAKKLHSTNELSALVVEALREAHYVGKAADSSLWRKAANYWVKAQAPDGGFRAVMEQYGGVGEMPTVMRTAAGLSSLLATLDMAFSAGGRNCTQYRANSSQIEAIGRSWDWLTANYRVTNSAALELTQTLENLVAQGNNPFLQTFYLYRATAVSGRNVLAGYNLFQAEARNLLDYYPRGTGLFAGNELSTAQVFVALASANAPTVVQRIIVGGDEASRYQRDAEHLMRYLSSRYDRTLNWRETSIDRPMRELVTVPILYLSIEAPVQWTDRQWAKLREYCFEGGVVLINIDEESGAREQLEKSLADLFPEYRLGAIAGDDPIWSIEDDLRMADPPRALGNGLKNFVFVTPDDWSCILQLDQHEEQPEPFRFVHHLLAYTTDRTALPGTLEASPYDPGALGARTIRVAHLEGGGSDVPVFPDLVKTLNRLMRANYRVNLEQVKPEAGGDEAPILLWVTQTGTGELTAAQWATIVKQMRNGAYVFMDVASGAESWAESLRGGVRKADPGLELARMSAGHPVYTGKLNGTLGFDIGQVAYRQALRTKDAFSGRCPLYMLILNGREVGAWCSQDVCSGVSYMQFPGDRGPMPTDSRELAMNVILRAMERQLESAGGR